MVTVQSVLSWFGGRLSYEDEKSSVSEEKSSAQSNAESNAESNEEEKLESVSPASDIFPKLNGNSMEINGYTAPPSNDKNGELASFGHRHVLVSPAANDRRVILQSWDPRDG